jgi:predicted DNA-binding transcriptional regulator AlpA
LRLLNWDDLREKKGIKDSKATIYRKMAAGKFPKAIYPGKSPAWVDSEVDDHTADLIAKRDGEGGA